MSQCHGIKGKTTDEAFQEQFFQWERGDDSSAVTFFSFHVFYMRKKMYKTLKESKKTTKQKKHLGLL